MKEEKRKFFMPCNLQFFADPAGPDDPPADPPAPTTPQNDPPAPTGTGSSVADFTKLLELVQGKQRVSEDSVLKGYFKQQGLSGDEMAQAIQAFKDQKVANTPDAEAIAKERDELKVALEQQMITNAATLEAVKLGIPEATVPYVLKLADFNEVIAEGKLKDGAIKASIEEVLTAVPALKPTQEQGTGFKIGGDGTGSSSETGTGQSNTVTAQKRWNRFK